MASSLTLDAKTARHVILHLQGLTSTPNRKLDCEALHALICQLGFVQIDSIQWVERAHHMILFARNQTYRKSDLKNLVETQRKVFENWTHDAAYLPSEFFPYWRHKFDRERERLFQKFTKWQGAGFGDHLDGLLKRIREDGPIMSRQLERTTGKQEMWQWHDGKAALEYLWLIGKLGIGSRQNFQKTYDLMERCIPETFWKKTVSHEAFTDWACRTALEKLGFGTPANIARYWDLLSIDEVKNWLAGQGEKDGLPITVRGRNRQEKQLYARADLEEVIACLPDLPTRVRALSPFDPVIRDRDRLSWLWGFEYRIEIYVPQHKRRWGYYIFPLLEADTLIGRVDMKADRKAKGLTVKKVWLEPGIRPSKGRRERLEQEFKRQARFCALDGVEWDGKLHDAQ